MMTLVARSCRCFGMTGSRKHSIQTILGVARCRRCSVQGSHPGIDESGPSEAGHGTSGIGTPMVRRRLRLVSIKVFIPQRIKHFSRSLHVLIYLVSLLQARSKSHTVTPRSQVKRAPWSRKEDAKLCKKKDGSIWEQILDALSNKCSSEDDHSREHF